MAIRLVENDYGKARVRLLRVMRQEGRHDIRDLTLTILFEGDFESAHTKGDNRKILPTDTIKNTVYVLARQYPIEAVEDFSLHLIEHFLTFNSQVSLVRIEASENIWARMLQKGKQHPAAFSRGEGEKRTAVLRGTREGATIHAGIEDLVVLKTTNSAFEGFLRDPYTTLKEERERILSTVIRARWLYEGQEIEFNPAWHGIRQTLLDTFADHNSRSLQHTLYAMGEAVLGSFENVREIHLSLPNKHLHLVDLTAFGLDNPGEVYLPVEEPHGLIEATLRRE